MDKEGEMTHETEELLKEKRNTGLEDGFGYALIGMCLRGMNIFVLFHTLLTTFLSNSTPKKKIT